MNHKERRLWIAIAVLASLSLLLASCGQAPTATPKPTAPPPADGPLAAPTAKAAAPGATKAPAAAPTPKPAVPTPSPKPAAEQPRYGGTLSISSFDRIGPHYDIHQSSAMGAVFAFQHAYNNLVQYHPHEPTKIIGDLAQSWDVSSDGVVYTFRLHKGVKWHDGRPFTSADAKFSLDRMYDPPKGTLAPRLGELMKGVKGVEAPDPGTVRVTLKYTSASFIPGLATVFPAMFPKHVIEEKGDMKRTIVGTGPFKFKSDIPDSSFEVVKNKEYFKEGRPYLDAIKTYVILDAATRFAALRTKRIQMTFPAFGLTPSQLEQAKRELPELVIAQFEGQSFVGYFFLVSRPPWNDVRVRKAISLALDRQGAVRVLEEGLGAVAGPMPPGPWAFSQDEISKLPGYRQPKDQDRVEAKRLLAEAGFAGGLKFSLSIRAGRYYESAAEFFKDQVANVGVEVSIMPMEMTPLYDRLYRGELEAVQMKQSWTLHDPDDILLPFYRSKAAKNFGDYSDSEIDRLLEEQSVTMDEAKRKEIVLKLQRVIIDKVPFVEMYWANSVMAWWQEVRNFTRPLSQWTYWRMEDVWLGR